MNTYLDAVTPRPPTTQTHEGGTAFAVDRWQRLRRFLILGAEGTFYATGRELTIENAGIVRECLAEDGLRTLVAIRDVSDRNLAAKHEPVLLALAMASVDANPKIRSAALGQLAVVCRTGTHLLHFAAYRDALGGGWGRGMRRAVGNWFNGKTANEVARQAVKYQQRDGWSLADLLRLAHPTPASPEHDAVYKWIVDGEVEPNAPALIAAADLAPKIDPALLPALIRDERLPREIVPSERLNDPFVWDALLADMPLTAMIRNLAKMSAVGLLTANSAAARTIADRLQDGDRLRRARVHPIAILAALKVYEQGHGERGSLTWRPVKSVVTALDDAFYSAFGNVDATGKKIRIALDVSASMDGNKVNGMPFLTAREVSAAFALVTAAVEPHVEFVTYSHTIQPVALRPTMRLDEVIRTLSAIQMGGTICSLAVTTAPTGTEAIISWTDSETIDGAGYRWSFRYPATESTASDAVRAYRQRTGIPLRHAVAAVASNGFTIADPSDPGQLDIVGFSADTPQVLAQFIGGVV